MSLLENIGWWIIIWFSIGYHTDEQCVVTADIYKKHLLKIPIKYRWLFIFSKRSSRTWFLKISVIAEICGYLSLVTGVIFYFCIKDPVMISRVIELNYAVISGYLLFVVIPYYLYYRYKSNQFKKSIR